MEHKTIKLINDSIDELDIESLISWLRTYPRLTKGELTREFEKKFAFWIGSKYSVFLNSGSSANLLMLYSLIVLEKLKNKKVVVPALSWATDLSPVIQLNLEPILVDCNLSNLSVDLNHLEQIFKTQNPSCLILVSVLGLSPNMNEITKLCEKYDVILLEDNCESQGTKFNDKKLGNFGVMSSFSTYYGHTMSTIEGGLITTNDEEIYNTLVMLRSHGWSRDLSLDNINKLNEEWNIDEFNSLYTFFEPGFNLRSTDLQAFIGLRQLEKVDRFIEQRNINFKKYEKHLKSKTWFVQEIQNSFTSSFCIPIITKSVENKKNLVQKFTQNNIECRPLISGSMGNQPFYKKRYGVLKLQNSELIDNCGIYVPNHPELTDMDINLICDIILENEESNHNRS
jgi:CDP-6-deoxy-D-xylo-4-hexulose-3-dehydrase